jgi:hypothetical protein
MSLEGLYVSYKIIGAYFQNKSVYQKFWRFERRKKNGQNDS